MRRLIAVSMAGVVLVVGAVWALQRRLVRGGNPGTPSEEGLTHDAVADWVRPATG